MSTNNNRTSEREVHHAIGMKDGKAEGCAHSDTELRAYIDFGRISNPDCPNIRAWNSIRSDGTNEQDNQ